MINKFEVIETNKMIDNYNLDVRTITLGISLMDCISDDLDTLNKEISRKSCSDGRRYFERIRYSYCK